MSGTPFRAVRLQLMLQTVGQPAGSYNRRVANGRDERVLAWAAVAGVGAIAGLMAWLAGWTGEARIHRGVDALLVFAGSLPSVLLWLAAAAGLGWPLMRLLGDAHPRAGLQAAMGVALLLVLDSALGHLGVLQWGGTLGAWVLTAIGIALLLIQLALAYRRSAQPRQLRLPLPYPLFWAAAPALAVLLLAACSAPGWLWASEFGGYDALSYHLQLPKEWLAHGRIEPLRHNVYSFLPGYVEAAYYHLDILAGDPIAAAYACQLLHASFAILTAWLIGCLGTRWFGALPIGRLAGPLAAAIFLGIPWVVVVGSLGYNEMATTLMLSAGLLVCAKTGGNDLRRAGAIGLLAGAACGAKLTSVGFVAAPLLVALISTMPARRWMAAATIASVTGLLALAPWLISNGLATGNPVFPFFTTLLGSGHWTADQVATFLHGHMPELSVPDRLVEGWNQLMRYGMSANPSPQGDPWQPHWSLLPWLAIAGFTIAMMKRPLRRPALVLGAMFAVQVVFWLLLTHVKSRFLFPAAVPASLLAAGGFASLLARPRGLVLAALGAMVLAWCCLPVLVFHREARGGPSLRIGMAELLAGDDLSDADAKQLAEAGAREIYVNRLLPRTARVLLVGDATPFYYRADVTYQTTWDRGPLSVAMRAHPDDPGAWLADLRGEGFTHLLVDAAMLRLWERAGWNDPLITAERVINAAQRFAALEKRFPDDVTLYRLDPPR